MSDKYPEGKINQDDEGELELRIVPHEGRVIMSWGKSVVCSTRYRSCVDQDAEEAERQSAHLKP